MKSETILTIAAVGVGGFLLYKLFKPVGDAFGDIGSGVGSVGSAVGDILKIPEQIVGKIEEGGQALLSGSQNAGTTLGISAGTALKKISDSVSNLFNQGTTQASKTSQTSSSISGILANPSLTQSQKVYEIFDPRGSVQTFGGKIQPKTTAVYSGGASMGVSSAFTTSPTIGGVKATIGAAKPSNDALGALVSKKTGRTAAASVLRASGGKVNIGQKVAGKALLLYQGYAPYV